MAVAVVGVCFLYLWWFTGVLGSYRYYLLPLLVLVSVLALAGKPLGLLSGKAVDHLERSEVESKLTLLGCIVFSNRLKADTRDVLGALQGNRCSCIIATGDNPLVALTVAKECGVIINQSGCVEVEDNIHSPSLQIVPCVSGLGTVLGQCAQLPMCGKMLSPMFDMIVVSLAMLS